MHVSVLTDHVSQWGESQTLWFKNNTIAIFKQYGIMHVGNLTKNYH